MKKAKYIFNLGLNDQTTRRQEITTIEAMKLANRLTTEAFGGCTIKENNGGYKYKDDEIIEEVSLEIEVVDYWSIDDVKALEHKELLKRIFNQEDVQLAKTTIEIL